MAPKGVKAGVEEQTRCLRRNPESPLSEKQNRPVRKFICIQKIFYKQTKWGFEPEHRTPERREPWRG
ncbi:hypothetical protein AGMMS50293_28940 [Spirochaetia bacterium]|nr:hypothetical protein AGMMS50293_28940 [Spirochaetia bacterium]